MRGCKRKLTDNRSSDMHPRNLYFNNPPDFGKLLLKDKAFAQFALPIGSSGKYRIDWKNPLAVRALTKALLLHDFGIKFTLPLNRLCPPLPNRLNYIHWIEDLLAMFPKNDDSQVRGIDIGTGASCIYPLLGARLNNWNYLATDIDEESLNCAIENIKANEFQGKIVTRLVKKNAMLLKVMENDEIRYDFCMTNPPFFDSLEEWDHNPSNSCSGSLNELTTPGGDLEFVKRIVDDSISLKNRILWYTSLIGRKATLRSILSVLRSHNIKNIHTTSFFQGRTTRWGVAWSFMECNDKELKVMKVFGANKEKKRREGIMQFCLDIESTEVIKRIIGYSETHQNVKIIEETYLNYVIQIEQDQKIVLKAFLSIKVLDKASSSLEIILDTTELTNLSYSLFWKFCDQFKADIQRTGRKWRRISKE